MLNLWISILSFFQAPPLGWELSCGDKPAAWAWVDAPGNPCLPPLPVSAWLFWSPTTDPTQGSWARAEAGGKVGLYAAIPPGSYVWPVWTVGPEVIFPAHAASCP